MVQQRPGDNPFEDVMKDIQKIFDNFKKKNGSNGGFGGGGGGGNSGGFLHGSFGVAILVAIIVLVILGGFKSFYTVQPDEVGVVTRFGEYHSTAQPGPHFKIPWVDKVYKVNWKRRQEEEFGYRENTARRGGRVNLTEESLMLTGDLNLADVQWMVQYEISDPWKYLFHARDVRKTMRDVSMSVMRQVVGDRLVSEVLTVGRAEIAINAKELMQTTLNQYDVGIHITTIELQSVTPPEPVRPAFNDVNAAKQDIGVDL